MQVRHQATDPSLTDLKERYGQGALAEGWQGLSTSWQTQNVPRDANGDREQTKVVTFEQL